MTPRVATNPGGGRPEWAAAIPDARLRLLEGVRPFPSLEVPERFFTAVDEFLQGPWPDGTQTAAGR